MNNTNEAVRVGIADLNIVRAPNHIRTLGLGSCVGIVIYDELKQIAGLSHILLPDSSHTKQEPLNQYKYADTAIPLLVNLLMEKGVRKHALLAKIAGGAQMFKVNSGSDLLRIGPRNIEAATEQLKKFNIPIVAQDVGGNIGRTIEFSPVTSRLKIKKVNQKEFFI